MHTRFHFYVNHLHISGKPTLPPGLGRPSTTCRAATAAPILHKRLREELTPLGGNMDPWYLWSWFFESIDPWFMYSSNLWSTSLCAARAVDHRSKLDTTNFTTLHLGDQSSKISVLANYLVTKHRYICMKFATTVIWWRKLANPICSVFFRKPSHDVISIHFTENAPKM